MTIAQVFDGLTENELRNKECGKWQKYGDDILPLWVADMDFPIADVIKDALRAHIDTNNFGYPPEDGLPGLKEATLARLASKHNWQVKPEELGLINGIVPSLYLSVMALSSYGDEVLIPCPVYGPITAAVEKTGRKGVRVPLVQENGSYVFDMDAFESAVTPATRILMLCHPHNPIGRAFTRDELEALAAFALKHRLWVISDELHSDLVFSGSKHIPFASLNDEIAQRTLTVFGPTKTFNIAGLKIGFIVSQNPKLLEAFNALAGGLMGKPNSMAQAATMAAFTQGDAWLAETLAYLQANRDFVANYLQKEMPYVNYTPPEATYLAWLDFRHYKLENPETFALEEAKVALNDGGWFGSTGSGFLRLNFATSRSIINEALERICVALKARA